MPSSKQKITNPWTIVSSKHIYENPWISVREDQVITPSATKGIYGTVSFKHIAIGIIPIDDKGYTYLVGQYRYPLNEYSWEIPMGGGKLNEPLLEAAQRELKEETGISARQWEQLLKIHTSNAVCDEVGYVFIAKDLSFGNASPDETEDLKVKKVPLETACEMALNGEITDSLSLAGLLKVKCIL